MKMGLKTTNDEKIKENQIRGELENYVFEQDDIQTGRETYLPRIKNAEFARFTPPSSQKTPDFDGTDSDKSLIYQLGIMNQMGQQISATPGTHISTFKNTTYTQTSQFKQPFTQINIQNTSHASNK